MSPRRLLAVMALDLRHCTRRPLYWIWLAVLLLMAWGLSQGHVTISSGDSSVGGTKAHITSMFANAQLLALFVPLLYAFFMAVAAGMTVIQDDEHRIGPILHATPLTAGEYVWGKYLAGFASFVVVVLLQLALAMFFNHAVPDADGAEHIGALHFANYVAPALVFALPAVVSLSGLAFLLGTVTRRPILVFFFPVALFLADVFLLWEEAPEWMPSGLDRALMWLDPSGFRWLNSTFLHVDRGVEFYNSAPIPLEAGFAASRLGLVLLGLASVFLAQRHFARNLRGSASVGRARAQAVEPAIQAPERAGLAGLDMRSAPISFLAGTRAVASVEFRALLRSPGLYLFVPLILLEVFGDALFQNGVFETPMLMTSGTIATSSFGLLTSLLAFLLLFYTVESLRREESSGFDALHSATPVSTGAILAGKALANSAVGLVTLLATFLACAAALLYQGKVGIELGPFVLLWGVILLPTLFFWTSFVAFLHALTRSRYTTYALALGALAWTGWKVTVGELSWATNWALWRSLRWSDIGTFELVRSELVLNRLLVLAWAVLFLVLTVRLHPRRGGDATARLLRLRPAPLAKAAWRLTPSWLPVVVLTCVLVSRVEHGFQGGAAEKAAKDYWRKNIATWKDAPLPDLAGVEFTLELEPAERRFEMQGEYLLANRTGAPLAIVAVSRGSGWRKPANAELPAGLERKPADAERPLWTLAGVPFEPEDAAGLALFRLPEPLAPGAELTLGFHYESVFPAGATENGGGSGEFVLPSSIVLTSFGPSFAPWIGFMEGPGIDEDNQSDAREYADDFYLGETPSGFGPAGVPYPVRMTLRGPAEFTLNGVGTLVADEVADGRRTSVWQSDHPVRIFNVVAGRWEVARGTGTAIYYHAAHAYNVPAMLAALDAARARYSEWFYPYPWELLKLSEFSGIADYAQGFATNITFSESIGFLARAEDTLADAPFLITAHESAHQWWGNLLTPGKGPGADLLSEGMAHFSTLLLIESERGLAARIAFAERIEEQYCEQRQADSERALVKIDGSRAGDTTVTYDKAGFVFWMLLGHMGREANLSGLRAFLAQYRTSRDHAVLQDFLASMRPFAPDAAAYDAFTRQWFHEVALPEYELAEVARSEVGDGTWKVVCKLTNTGTGRMPIELAAARGVRFQRSAGGASDVQAASPADEYREVRTAVVLGSGESAFLELIAPFEPRELRTDPDALVLMQARENARHAF